MKALRTRMLLTLTAASLLSVASCSDRVKLARVKGSVTLDGKPLAKGTIIFESKGQRPATGSIVNGEIVEVTTYAAGDGVPLGNHQVGISAVEDAASAVAAHPGENKGGPDYMVGKSLIPTTYNTPATSGLVAEINSGENTVDFKLFSRPAQAGK